MLNILSEESMLSYLLLLTPEIFLRSVTMTDIGEDIKERIRVDMSELINGNLFSVEGNTFNTIPF